MLGIADREVAVMVIKLFVVVILVVVTLVVVFASVNVIVELLYIGLKIKQKSSLLPLSFSLAISVDGLYSGVGNTRGCLTGIVGVEIGCNSTIIYCNCIITLKSMQVDCLLLLGKGGGGGGPTSDDFPYY